MPKVLQGSTRYAKSKILCKEIFEKNKPIEEIYIKLEMKDEETNKNYSSDENGYEAINKTNVLETNNNCETINDSEASDSNQFYYSMENSSLFEGAQCQLKVSENSGTNNPNADQGSINSFSHFINRITDVDELCKKKLNHAEHVCLNLLQKDVLHLWNAVTLKSGLRHTVLIKTHKPPISSTKVSGKENELKKIKSMANYVLRPKKACPYKEHVDFDDTFLFCEECNQEYEGNCELHPYLLLINTEIPRNCSEERRAKLTAPWPISVCPSKVENAGYGVWTEAALPRGIVLGPYEGKIIDHNIILESEYDWSILDKKPANLFVDAVDPSISNWLKFVNCSSFRQDTNLVPFQYKRQIYYKTSKHINRGAELIVWYGDDYARKLGITNINYNQNVKEGHIKIGCSPAILLQCEINDNTQKMPSAYSLLQRYLSKNETIERSIIDQDPNLTFSDKQYTCAHCYKKFKYKRNLIRHIKLHTGENLCKCAICGKEFTNKQHLAEHLRIHTGELPFVGTVGNQAFSTNNKLTTHTRIHVQESPYGCTICNKRFNDSNSLSTHNRYHSGEKPFDCTICNKKFRLKHHLTEHSRIHSGEKPFVCRNCDRKFNKKSSLNRHIKTVCRILL